uniref:Uncharacterized protein n=1 Tax=Fundulus heteroclitus TaxID=8078 RepID=A0A3Q2QLM0_FUNHE
FFNRAKTSPSSVTEITLVYHPLLPSNVEQITGSMCFFVLLCLCSVFSNPQSAEQMTVHTEPGSAGGFSFPLKGSFALHYCFMYSQYEGLLQSLRQCRRLSPEELNLYGKPQMA